MKTTIDFETRSAEDLKKAGVWKYAEHKTTDVLCLAIKINYGRPKIWLPEFVRGILWKDIQQHYLKDDSGSKEIYVVSDKELSTIIKASDIIEAHNAEFERAIWYFIMYKRFGFKDLPLEKMRCSAAKAAVHSLPRSLDKAIKALGLNVHKDMEGYKLMMKMCKPKRLVKKELQLIADEWSLYFDSNSSIKDAYNSAKETLFEECMIGPEDPDIFLKWHESPKDIVRLCQYCAQDVEAEYTLSERLSDLSPVEQKLWFYDQKINQRGAPVDVSNVKAIIDSVQNYEINLLNEVPLLVPDLKSTRQVAATRDWINENIPEPKLENLQKDTVINTLKRSDLPKDVRRILEIKNSLGKSSVSKFDTLRRMAGKDNRIRGLFMYHGASTGRWSGKGFQPQNLPRKSYKDVELALDILTKKPGIIEVLFGNLMETATTLVRPMIKAPEGKELVCADFASIEGRVLAWIAGEEYILENYRKEKCAYCSFASQIYKKEYDEIYEGWQKGTKEYKDMRFEGKTGELACGYQGGEKAILNFASDMELKQRLSIVKLWRTHRPETVSFWYAIEETAMQAVYSPMYSVGKAFEYNGIKYSVKDNFLLCRLPSGRLLRYYDPKIITKIIPASRTPFLNEKGEVEYKNIPARKKKTISYMGMDSKTHQWVRIFTYGGKLTENIVQAIARDLLKEALINLEKEGHKVILHIHDEIVVEAVKGEFPLDHLISIITKIPAWAGGLPLNADGWTGERYKK